MAKRPNPLSFLPLHPLELRILMILLEGVSHGYAIAQEIGRREQHLKGLYPANLYRRIRDLLAKGLLEDAPAPGSEESDPRRRYFRVTELGKKVVWAEAERMKGLLDEAWELGLLSAKG